MLPPFLLYRSPGDDRGYRGFLRNLLCSARSAVRHARSNRRRPRRVVPILMYWRLVSFIHNPSSDRSFSTAASLKSRDCHYDWYRQTSRHQARNIALSVVRGICHGEEDQWPPGDERKVEAVHEPSGDRTELQVVACEICHPRVPESLWCVSSAEKVEGEEVRPV